MKFWIEAILEDGDTLKKCDNCKKFYSFLTIYFVSLHFTREPRRIPEVYTLNRLESIYVLIVVIKV